jgi:hypothetical protein
MISKTADHNGNAKAPSEEEVKVTSPEQKRPVFDFLTGFKSSWLQKLDVCLTGKNKQTNIVISQSTGGTLVAF